MRGTFARAERAVVRVLVGVLRRSRPPALPSSRHSFGSSPCPDVRAGQPFVSADVGCVASGISSSRALDEHLSARQAPPEARDPLGRARLPGARLRGVPRVAVCRARAPARRRAIRCRGSPTRWRSKLRAGKVSASAIAETMGLMNKAMGVLSGAAAAGKSVANDFMTRHLARRGCRGGGGERARRRIDRRARAPRGPRRDWSERHDWCDWWRPPARTIAPAAHHRPPATSRASRPPGNREQARESDDDGQPRARQARGAARGDRTARARTCHRVAAHGREAHRDVLHQAAARRTCACWAG